MDIVPGIGLADIAFANHRDFALLLDRDFSGDGPDRRREAAQAAFEAFPALQVIASTARELVGADHHRITARIDRRNDWVQTAALDITDIVDRIGTGDAFAAGVLHGLAEKLPLADVANAGLAMAAIKHSLPGDACAIDRSDLRDFSTSQRDVAR